MRKALAALAMSALLLPTLAVGTSANDGWSFDIVDANLLAKGAAVEVTFDTVCPAPTPTYYSADIDVTQRVGGGKIATGGLTMYYSTLQFTCDGSTVNSSTALVTPETGVAFKNGVALVTVIVRPGSMVPELLPAVEEVKLSKAK